MESTEEVLLSLSEGRREPSLIDELFRHVHTIKGSSSVVGLNAVASFTHDYENLLGRIREGVLALDETLIALLMEGLGHIEKMLQMSLDGDPSCAPLQADSAHHRTRLQAYLAPFEIVASAPQEELPEAIEEFDGIFLFTDDEEEDEPSPEVAAQPEPSPEVAAQPGPSPAPAAPVAKKTKEAGAGRPRNTLRVSSEGLDSLVNLIGELVTISARARTQVMRSSDAELRQTIAHQTRLLEDVRDVALGLRMLPVDSVFKRYRRMVYDVSRKLGKNVQLEVRGGETELDKTVLDRIGDPLTHLVRNAIDHGIESPEQRQAQGKSAVATVRLVASQEHGTVTIEVSDDGKGLDLPKIHARAIERGLIEPNELAVDDPRVADLITLPGLSTQESVTSLSGRGVGMDVVRRNVEALSGTLSIRTEPGKGSRFTIRLPVTLSIIRGFIVRIAGSPFVIPMGRVEECISLHDDGDGLTGLSALRGHSLPFVRMRTAFGEDPTGGRFLVVVRSSGEPVGLLVDVLEGESQAVVKNLGPLFAQQGSFNGATVLGSGEIALIIDVDALVQSCLLKQSAEHVA